MNLACTQEVREAILRFRDPSKEVLAAGDEGEKAGRHRFTVAVADTFGEGTPVRNREFGGVPPSVDCPRRQARDGHSRLLGIRVF